MADLGVHMLFVVSKGVLDECFSVLSVELTQRRIITHQIEAFLPEYAWSLLSAVFSFGVKGCLQVPWGLLAGDPEVSTVRV